MIHILLADLGIRRDGDIALRWPIENLRKLAGREVRVVFDDPRALKPVLRALCASDVGPIELLDIDGPQWSLVSYDTAPLRAALRGLGLKPEAPSLMHMSRDAAYWLIARLTNSEAVA